MEWRCGTYTYCRSSENLSDPLFWSQKHVVFLAKQAGVNWFLGKCKYTWT